MQSTGGTTGDVPKQKFNQENRQSAVAFPKCHDSKVIPPVESNLARVLFFVMSKETDLLSAYKISIILCYATFNARRCRHIRRNEFHT